MSVSVNGNMYVPSVESRRAVAELAAKVLANLNKEMCPKAQPTQTEVSAIVQEEHLSSPPTQAEVPMPRGLFANAFRAHGQGIDMSKEQGLEFFKSGHPDDDLQTQIADRQEVTLMVRNVPVMYTQAMLMLEWDGGEEFNFLYLPRNSAGKRNLSYAFINFESEASADKFRARWDKKRLEHHFAKKPLNISLAEVQGLAANLSALETKYLRQGERTSPAVFVRAGNKV
jgi:hypothetical protein